MKALGKAAGLALAGALVLAPVAAAQPDLDDLYPTTEVEAPSAPSYEEPSGPSYDEPSAPSYDEPSGPAYEPEPMPDQPESPVFDSPPVEPDPLPVEPVEPVEPDPLPVEPDPIEPVEPVEPDPLPVEPVDPEPVEQPDPEPVEPAPVNPEPVEPAPDPDPAPAPEVKPTPEPQDPVDDPESGDSDVQQPDGDDPDLGTGDAQGSDRLPDQSNSDDQPDDPANSGETPSAADPSHPDPDSDPSESGSESGTGDSSTDESSESDRSALTPDDPANGVPDDLNGPGQNPDLDPPDGAGNPHEDTTTGHTPNADANGDMPEGQPNGDAPEDQASNQPLVVPPAPIIPAPVEAVEAARSGPLQVVDVERPPPPPPSAPKVDFVTQVNQVIQNNYHTTVINNTITPVRVTTIEYNEYHQPVFYNPYRNPFSVYYFYAGAYHTMWVPVGGRVALTVPVVGVYPFTAVMGSHVMAGDFCGGSYVAPAGHVGPPPPSWRPPPPPVTYVNRTVYVPSAQRSVQVRKVTVVGHDTSKSVGKQDTFMLNDSTLAWGQDKGNGQIDIAATQTLPGVGPIDEGESLITVAMGAGDEGSDWQWWAGGTALAVLAAGGVTWFIRRRPKAAAYANGDPPTDSFHLWNLPPTNPKGRNS